MRTAKEKGRLFPHATHTTHTRERVSPSPSQSSSNISLHDCAALAFALGRHDPRDASNARPDWPNKHFITISARIAMPR
jgi:hypothetical protein